MAELYTLDLPPAPPRDLPVASLVLMAIFAMAMVLYPFVADGAIERFGVRGVGGLMLGFGAVSFVAGIGLRRWMPSTLVELGALPGLGVALLALLGLLSGTRLPLLLVPAWACAVAGWAFATSLRSDVSLIERGARTLHAHAPDFIGPYCRAVTAAWWVFLWACAATIVALAVAAPLTGWTAFTTWGIYVAMLLGCAVEFVIRKIRFRYYPFGGPIDRVFSTLFPSERTELGRRSHAYILEMRHKLAAERRGDGLERVPEGATERRS